MIPIQNLYYLLCYAWGHLDEGRVVQVSAASVPTLQDLFARVLIGGTKRVLRDGLYRGYVEESIDTNAPRGKINLSESLKRGLVARQRLHCTVDKLTHDVLHNQILKTSISRLQRTHGLDGELRHQLLSLRRRMVDIGEVALAGRTFTNVQLHRNNRFYRFLMNICELVHHALLPEQDGGAYRFRDFTRDEVKMRRVFQDFVVNFYRTEQRRFRVSRDHIRWDAEALDADSKDVLPGMETDVVLRDGTRTIVIDTKYYLQALTTRFNKESIRSEHLFQLYSYLRNLEPNGGPDRSAEGVLLYPVVDEGFRYRYRVSGHDVTVRTIDLRKDATEIRTELLNLIE